MAYHFKWSKTWSTEEMMRYTLFGDPLIDAEKLTELRPRGINRKNPCPYFKNHNKKGEENDGTKSADE